MGKSRKKIGRSFGILLLALALIACKREVEPSLQVTVVNNANEGIPGAWLEVSVDRANAGVISPDVIDSAITDEYGEATFDFDNTVIVDVAVYKSNITNVVEDSLSVLVETKRKYGKENITKRKLVIRD